MLTYYLEDNDPEDSKYPSYSPLREPRLTFFDRAENLAVCPVVLYIIIRPFRNKSLETTILV
jgi:hypothetical protein